MTSRRRGTCPALAAPLPTGDGLLARLAVARAMPLDRFAALCTAARTHGNGTIEITSRGSIQVRGLAADSAPLFAAEVEALEIADAVDDRVLANPLAGFDPHETFDVSGTAGRLREALAESGLAAKLAPKVSVVIDGGGALHLDAVPCDVRLRAAAASDGVQFKIAVPTQAGAEVLLCAVAPEHAVGAVLELLTTIAAAGPTVRARDLPFPTQRGELKHARLPAEAIGTHGLRDGRVALGVGFTFGHSDADALLKLVEKARHAHAVSMRPAAGRVLLMIGLLPREAPVLAAAAARLGFITKPDDPRRRVVACSGAPACAAAEIPTRALAATVAAATALDGATTIHLSGCTKGCAHPSPAAITIVGIEGKCGIVRNGGAQDVPVEFVTADDLPRYLAEPAAIREAAHG